jgi:hypothetical protein
MCAQVERSRRLSFKLWEIVNICIYVSREAPQIVVDRVEEILRVVVRRAWQGVLLENRQAAADKPFVHDLTPSRILGVAKDVAACHR